MDAQLGGDLRDQAVGLSRRPRGPAPEFWAYLRSAATAVIPFLASHAGFKNFTELGELHSCFKSVWA